MMSKFCSKCGKALNDNSRFCDGCGTQVIEINNQIQENQQVDNNMQHEINNSVQTEVTNYNNTTNQLNSVIEENTQTSNSQKPNRAPIVVAFVLLALGGICGIGIIISNLIGNPENPMSNKTKVNEKIIQEYVTETIKKDKYSSIDEIAVKKEDKNNYNVTVSYKNHESKIEDVATLISLSNYDINYLIETESNYNNYIKDITFTISSPENGYYFIYKDFKNMDKIEDTHTIVSNLTIEDQDHKKVTIDMEAAFKANYEKSKEKYKAQCETYDYKTISRYPDEYKGKKAKFTGKVVQVIEGTETLTYYRVNVTKTEYQYIDYVSWDDTIYVTFFVLSSDKKFTTRILEDDIVNIYGTLDGLKSYESVSGSTITIPAVSAEYIELAQ